MKKRKGRCWKKTLYVFGTGILILSLFAGVYQFSRANSYDSPNVVMLEAMLNGDRRWVINTLVDDNRSTNPYNNGKSLMETALSQYQNIDDPNYREIYTIMVDMLNDYYYSNSWKQDFQAIVVDKATEIAQVFSGDEEFLSFGNDLKQTAEEQHYEDILTDVFSDDYTTSWGESVGEQEESIKYINEMSNSINSLSKLTSYWKSLYGPGTSEAENLFDYMDEVAVPLIDSGEEYLKVFNKLETREQQLTGSVMVMASSLGTAHMFTRMGGSWSGETLAEDLIDYVAGDDAKQLIGGLGKGLSFSSGALSQYAFLNSLCQQKQQFHDTLIRVSDKAKADGNDNMSRVFSRYAEMMDDALDTNKIGYDIVVKNLQSQNLILNETIKMAPGYKQISKYLDEKRYVDHYASLAKLFHTGMFLVDKSTGLKQACLGTAELCYLRNIINETRTVYYKDLSNYQSRKTDANAKKVLDDLQLLQRLRLQGENVSYKMSKAQLTSWYGKLVSGYSLGDWINGEEETEISKAWKNHYQDSVDSLIGATLNPIATKSFSVGSGESLFISYNKGKGTYQGTYTFGGQTKTLYEMQYRITAGINVNGGKLTVKDAAVPFINASNGSNIILDASTATVGEVTQSGDSILDIRNGDINFANCMDLQNVTVKNNGNTISSPDITCTSKVTLDNTTMRTSAIHLGKSAQVTNGTIICDGNIDGEYGTLPNLILNGTAKQTVANTIHTSDLTLKNSDNRAIDIKGNIYVSGRLSDTENIVNNLYLSENGDIAGNTIVSKLNLNGAKVSHAVTYKRGVSVTGNSSVNGGTIKGSLIFNGGTLTVNSKELEVNDGIYGGGGLILNKTMNVHGESHGSGLNMELNAPLNLYKYAYLNGTLKLNAPLNAYENIDIEQSTINTYDNFNAYKDTQISQSTLNLTDPFNIYGSASITNSSSTGDAFIKAYKDVSFGENSKKLNNLTFCGEHSQKISGTAYVNNLDLNNSGISNIKISGDIYISGILKDREDVVNSGLILTKTGDIEGNTAISHIGLQGKSFERTINFNRGVDIFSGESSIMGGIIKGALTFHGGTLSITSKDVEVKDGLFGNGKLIVNRALNVYGESHAGLDIQLNAPLNLYKYAYLSGTMELNAPVNAYDNIEMKEITIRGTNTFNAYKDMTVCNSAIELSSPCDVYGTAEFTDTSSSEETNVNLYGDGKFDMTSSKIIKNLRLCGESSQSISGTAKVQNLTLDNKEVLNIKVPGTIYVSGLLSDKKNIANGGIVLTETGELEGDIALSRLTLQGTVFDRPIVFKQGLTVEKATLCGGTVKGSLTVSGTLNNTSKELNVNSDLIGTGGVLNLEQPLHISGDAMLSGGTTKGELLIKGNATFSGITNDGTISVDQNITIDKAVTNNGSMSGSSVQITSESNDGLSGDGELLVRKDMFSKMTCTFGTLHFTGDTAQIVSGNDIYVTNLINDNTTQKGVSLKAQIYVTGELQNRGRLRGIPPILTNQETIISEDCTKENLVISEDTEIAEDTSVTIKNDMVVKKNIIVKNGAVLLVKGDFTADNISLTLEKGAVVKVRGNLLLQNATVVLNGEWTICRDAWVSGGTINGEGEWKLKGDLENQSTIKNLQTLSFVGRAPQKISGKEIHVTNIKCDNNSSHGIDLDSKVYYIQKDITEGTKIAGDNLLEEAK